MYLSNAKALAVHHHSRQMRFQKDALRPCGSFARAVVVLRIHGYDNEGFQLYCDMCISRR